MLPALPPAVREPWFRARPVATVVVASALFGLVTVVRFAIPDVSQPLSLFYALPVALLAVAFGRTAGLLSGVAALALVALWVWLEGVHATPLGWATRAVPLLLLGGLLGDATDRLRATELHRAALQAAAQRHRDALEINDSIVQGVAAARWALEAGHAERALDLLTETLGSSRRLVSDLLRDAEMSPDGLRGRPVPLPDDAEPDSARSAGPG